jgi:hypothetical protein
MNDVFISYAHEDRDRVSLIAEALKQHGWSVFWDCDITYGKGWRDVLLTEVKSARCVVVVWSSNSIMSDYVLDEAEEGKRREVLVPVRIEDVPLPLGFGGTQAGDLTGWSPSGEDDDGMQRLVQAIVAILGDRHEHPPLSSQIGSALKKIIHPVPIVGYALLTAAAGVIVAIIAGWELADHRVAVYGVSLLVILTVALLAAVRLAGLRKQTALSQTAPMIARLFSLLLVATSVLLMTSYFFAFPREIDGYLPPLSPEYLPTVTITGTVTSENGTPIRDALITIASYNFTAPTRYNGEFLGNLDGILPGEIIHLRADHKDYMPVVMDRKVDNVLQKFTIRLQKR